MKIFNYEIKKIVPFDMKRTMLDKAELNAQTGLIQAKLDFRLHNLLLGQLEEKITGETNEDLEREIRLTTEAVERDKKSINNWETQLRAIQYERNTKEASEQD